MGSQKLLGLCGALMMVVFGLLSACNTTAKPNPQDQAIDDLRTTQNRLLERVDKLESEMATKEALAAFDQQIKAMIEARLKVQPRPQVVVEKPHVTPIFRTPSANR